MTQDAASRAAEEPKMVRGVILADYRCGCTWMGKRRECIEYCAKHGENRRQIVRLLDPVSEKELGWDWQQAVEGV